MLGLRIPKEYQHIHYNMVYVMRFVVLFVTNKKINRRISHSDEKTGKRQRFTYKSESEGRSVKIATVCVCVWVCCLAAVWCKCNR